METGLDGGADHTADVRFLYALLCGRRSGTLGVNKGVIKEGYDADLVLLDDEMNVLMTLVGGEIVYKK